MENSSSASFKVVRLNASLYPVSAHEAGLYRQHGLRPLEVEASTPNDLVRQLHDCDALFVVSEPLPTAVIDQLTRCRVISRLGLGTDKIAVDTATRHGILVTNVPYFCVEEQADHAMAMLLSLARQMPRMTRGMAAGAFAEARAHSRLNQRLRGRTLGLVGFGNSAKQVAVRARSFGLQVIATRRRQFWPDPEAEALGVRLADLETLLSESDYVSLHLPLTTESRHLIDAAAIGKMKPGAILINTSRGALVDETALVAALREGRLAGAGLDTFEQIDAFSPEVVPPNHPLLELENVILTPHVAAGSVQAMEDVSVGGVENVAAVLNGYWPVAENIVNYGVVPRFPLRDRPSWR
jgi:phosphoglycerate dehydrogenase-like enzyme